MPKAHEQWIVFPHDPIEAIAPNLWRVVGRLDRTPLNRVMTIARRSDGDLVVHSAIALEEAAMKHIEGLGRVAFLLVPNRFHRLDARVYKLRYPHIRVFCPRGSRRSVEEVLPVDGTYDQFPGDEAVKLEHVAGTAEIEGAMIVRSPGDTTLVLNDILFNMPHARGIQGFILRRVTASSGGPRVSRVAKLFLVKDRHALAREFERFAALPELKRVIVSHHDPIDSDAVGVLRRVAQELG